jgi:hypothetical protein
VIRILPYPYVIRIFREAWPSPYEHATRIEVRYGKAEAWMYIADEFFAQAKDQIGIINHAIDSCRTKVDKITATPTHRT